MNTRFTANQIIFTSEFCLQQKLKTDRFTTSKSLIPNLSIDCRFKKIYADCDIIYRVSDVGKF